MSKPLDPRKIEFLDDATIAMLRSMTPAERLQRAFELTQAYRDQMAVEFHLEHPEWTQQQVQAAVAKRVLEESVDR